MGGYVKVATRSEISAGTMKTISVGGKLVAFVNIDGEFFAVSDTCSHAQCSLGGQGMLEGSVITCGCHGAQFDATNGKVLSLPAMTDIVSYEVKVEDDDVFIKT